MRLKESVGISGYKKGSPFAQRKKEWNYLQLEIFIYWNNCLFSLLF
jgi:hypothetical protein